MQRAELDAGCALRVALRGDRERCVGVHLDERGELVVLGGDAVERVADERGARRLAAAQRGGERGDPSLAGARRGRSRRRGRRRGREHVERGPPVGGRLRVGRERRERGGEGIGRDAHAGTASAARSASLSATAPNTPPCIVTILHAASWLPGSVAPVQSVSSRHS